MSNIQGNKFLAHASVLFGCNFSFPNIYSIKKDINIRTILELDSEIVHLQYDTERSSCHVTEIGIPI